MIVEFRQDAAEYGWHERITSDTHAREKLKQERGHP
jgi:hypothetical protein